jgi:hypothetical protein
MFNGSIPPDVRDILARECRHWKCDDVYVACSGNFTVERTLAKVLPKARLHGNDVTLYTSALGSWLSGKPLEFTLNPELAPLVPWLEESLQDPLDRLASLMLATNFAFCVGNLGRYYARLLEAYRDQWPTLLGKTRAKLEKLELRLESYFCGDAMEMEVPAEAGWISYPPVIDGGYEALWKHLEKLFLWKPPSYEVLTKERIAELVRRIMDREYFMLGRFDRLPSEFDPYLKGLSQTTNRGVPIWIYATPAHAVLAQPQQKVEPPPIPRLGAEEEIGQRLSLAPLTGPQFGALRSVYLNHKIAPGAPAQAWAVLVDGKLIGCFAVGSEYSTSGPSRGGPGSLPPPTAYLLSDFAIDGTAYPRLSKLVVMAAMSREAQQLMEQIRRRRIRSVMTTAFTERPNSMKYRSLLEQLTRKEVPDGYEINYGGPIGAWSLQEALQRWRRQWGERRVGAEPALTA